MATAKVIIEIESETLYRRDVNYAMAVASDWVVRHHEGHKLRRTEHNQEIRVELVNFPKK